MSTMSQTKQKGFTLLEIVIVVVLIFMIARMAFASFNMLNRRQILDKQVDYIRTIVQKTRLDSLNSKDGATFRVEFGSGQAVVHASGTTTTSVYPYTSNVVLTSTNLNAVSGGAATTTVFFSKISGLAGAQGTLTYSLMSGGVAVMTKTLTINALGIVE